MTGRTEAAKWWLIDYLASRGGEAPASEGLAAGASAGFPESTLSEARKRAPVTSTRSGFGSGAAYVWHLDLSAPQGERPKLYALACERPTKAFPAGRTGARAGYAAHRDAGESACGPCTDAHSAQSLARRRALPLDELQRYREGNARAAADRNAREPEKRRAEHLKFRKTNRLIIRAAKETPCADCGIEYPYYVMQFDHLGDKEFNIGQTGPTCSREKLLAEIAKCDVVCANCHAERSYQRQQAREVSCPVTR